MTAAPEVTTTVYRRATGVLSRVTGGSLLLLVRGGDGDLLELTGSGAALWYALETPLSAEECAAKLAADFGADPDTVRSAIEPVLDELALRGAVDVLQTAE